MTAGISVNTAPGSDADHDGMDLLVEYALGLDPLNTDATGLPIPALAGDFLTLTYTKNKAATDITVTAEVSSDLVNWSRFTGL